MLKKSCLVQNLGLQVPCDSGGYTFLYRKKLFILVAIILLLTIIYTGLILGMDSNNHFLEQVIQHSCKDCGFKSLVTACSLLGVEMTLDKVSNSFEPDSDITMYDLYKVAMNEELNAHWMGLSIDELLTEILQKEREVVGWHKRIRS